MTESTRRYSLVDNILMQLDDSLATVFAKQHAMRPNPAANKKECPLNPSESKKSEGLMRVNHTGEVCAQALYRAQLLSARDEKTQVMLMHAASEETDHLAWTHDRLQDLNGHRSYLNFYWYWHSFLIGTLAGVVGDQWSLGFVEETEKQVGRHLSDHLDRLPESDAKSRAIVIQMALDEVEHGQAAAAAGSGELPSLIKQLMTLNSRVMTTLAYFV